MQSGELHAGPAHCRGELKAMDGEGAFHRLLSYRGHLGVGGPNVPQLSNLGNQLVPVGGGWVSNKNACSVTDVTMHAPHNNFNWCRRACAKTDTMNSLFVLDS